MKLGESKGRVEWNWRATWWWAKEAIIGRASRVMPLPVASAASAQGWWCSQGLGGRKRDTVSEPLDTTAITDSGGEKGPRCRTPNVVPSDATIGWGRCSESSTRWSRLEPRKAHPTPFFTPRLRLVFIRPFHGAPCLGDSDQTDTAHPRPSDCSFNASSSTTGGRVTRPHLVSDSMTPADAFRQGYDTMAQPRGGVEAFDFFSAARCCLFKQSRLSPP